MNFLYSSREFWFALAATVALIGTIWQSLLGAVLHVEQMRAFLGPQDRLLSEELHRHHKNVPRWHVFLRRRRKRELIAEITGLLTREELRLSRRYDQQAWGWSLVMVAALIACIVTWIDVARILRA